MIINIIPFILFVIFFWLISLLDVFSIRTNVLQRSFIFLISIFLLCLFAGGRWSNIEAGYDIEIFDYSTYKNLYLNSLDIFNFISDYLDADILTKSHEIGYLFYSSLCHLIFSDNYNIYLLFTNTLLVILLYKCLNNNMANYAIFFLFYLFVARLYFQYNFIMMRQAISLFIIWTLGFPALINNKKIKYVWIVILATTFHISSIIALLALFLKHSYKMKYIYWFIIFIFIINISGIGKPIIILSIEKIVNIFLGGSDIANKLSNYLINTDESRGLNLLSFVEALPILLITIKYKTKLLEDKYGQFYYNMFYLYILLLAVTMNFGFLTRLCQYFIFSYIFLISYYCKNETNMSNRKIMLLCGSLYLMLYSVRYIFIWFYDSDYTFFLFKI